MPPQKPSEPVRSGETSKPDGGIANVGKCLQRRRSSEGGKGYSEQKGQESSEDSSSNSAESSDDGEQNSEMSAKTKCESPANLPVKPKTPLHEEEKSSLWATPAQTPSSPDRVEGCEKIQEKAKDKSKEIEKEKEKEIEGKENDKNWMGKKGKCGEVGLKDFEMLKLLGKGSFGKVLLVRKIDKPGQLYAMKVLKKADMQETQQRVHTRTERDILATVKHPNVVKMKYAFQTVRRLYLVLEYCPGGEMFFHLQNGGRFGERKARFYAANVILALEHFHSRSIIYREYVRCRPLV